MPKEEKDGNATLDEKTKKAAGGAGGNADDAGGAGDEGEADENDAGGAGDDGNDTVSRADHKKALADLHKYKAEARKLKKEQDDAKAARMKDEGRLKELAELKENEAKEAREEADRLKESFVSEKKFNVVQAECQKLGIRPEALSDLEGLDLGDVQIETTSTGKINVLGASKFAARLKSLKPHWFQDVKTTKVNTGGNRVLDSEDGNITPAMIYEAEKAGRKSGDMSEYNKLHSKFRQQQAGGRRH